MVSYDPTLVTARDHLRAALRDTDVETAILQDEELDGWLTSSGYPGDLNGYCLALARAADALSTHWGRMVSEYQEGSNGVSAKFDDRVAEYRRMANRARVGLIDPPVLS